MGNIVIKLGRTVRRNGVRSGVSQATSPGARSGREVLHRIWRGEKIGVVEVLIIGMNGGEVTKKGLKFWSVETVNEL